MFEILVGKIFRHKIMKNNSNKNSENIFLQKNSGQTQPSPKGTKVAHSTDRKTNRD